ncbi:TetR/AcrR family transcriptional regulator [Nonomuraea sp. NPDC046570]|uniref:TetR/AcrR family transcriptional regulator n=1 Tax=Nonomuraea sp. NPDC046570 TaxID=3155255 RepID=UPI00340DBF64
MPKVVDPEARRDAVVEAVFAVVRRDGLEQASLRNVAEEAGLAIGSIRHYFAGHTELMVFAMRAMSERLTRRLEQRAEPLLSDPPPANRQEATLLLLAELLPLDEPRREEATVWLAFATAARTRPELRPHAAEVHDGMRRLVTRVFDGGHRLGRLPAGTDVALEVERLCALLDGLTVEAILHPDRIDDTTLLRVLRRHLESLTACAPPIP